MGTKKGKKLPPNLELIRDYVVCGPEVNSHVNTVTSATAYMPCGVDNSWDFDEFKANFSVKVNSMNDEVMECELCGVDPSFANALRRILIAEIPTVAIEHVFVVNNTSIIQDEVLAHRLGLVPLLIDPTKLDYKSAEEASSEKNTVVFKLDITCKRVGDKVVNDKVLSSALQWLPQGSELPDETSCRFASGQSHLFPDASPRAVHDDILLAKLRPGQTIQLEAHCIKGIGKDHAKWSPVATAWYQFYPEIRLLKAPSPSQAAELDTLAPGLFYRDSPGAELKVHDAWGHMKHWEKLRRLLEQESWGEVLQLLKRKHHVIFTLESAGALPPSRLMSDALDILADKCSKLMTRV